MKIAKFENSIEEKVRGMLIHKDEMLDMLDNGSQVNDIYKRFNINNKYQPRFNAVFKEKFGFTLKEYRQNYLKKIKYAGHTARELKIQKYKNVIGDIVLSIMSGESVNDTLYKYKIFSPDRAQFEDFVKSVFGYGLLQIKQKPEYLDRTYVRVIADKLKAGAEMSDELCTETQNMILAQRSSMTIEEREKQEKKNEIQAEIDEHQRVLAELKAKKTKIENQYKRLSDAIENLDEEIKAEEISLSGRKHFFDELFKD